MKTILWILTIGMIIAGFGFEGTGTTLASRSGTDSHSAPKPLNAIRDYRRNAPAIYHANAVGNTTLWRDFSAVASARGNVAGCDVANTNVNPYWETGWTLNDAHAPSYIYTSGDGACAYFAIPYLAGSVLTRARVKWQAQWNDNGVRLRIVKRDESGTDTGWTVVGAPQIYKDSGLPYEVTVSTYDFPDETMEEGCSYAIEAESVVTGGSVNLFSVGIETSKRVY